MEYIVSMPLGHPVDLRLRCECENWNNFVDSGCPDGVWFRYVRTKREYFIEDFREVGEEEERVDIVYEVEKEKKKKLLLSHVGGCVLVCDEKGRNKDWRRIIEEKYDKKYRGNTFFEGPPGEKVLDYEIEEGEREYLVLIRKEEDRDYEDELAVRRACSNTNTWCKIVLTRKEEEEDMDLLVEERRRKERKEGKWYIDYVLNVDKKEKGEIVNSLYRVNKFYIVEVRLEKEANWPLLIESIRKEY